MREQGLDFEALLVATLRRAGAVGIQEAAVVDAEVGVADGSVLKGLSSKFAPLEDAPAAHELAAKSDIHPVFGSKVKGIAEDKALARTLADVGKEDSGWAYFAARRGRGVREPDKRHAEKAEVGIDDRNALIETDARVRSVELPCGMLGI